MPEGKSLITKFTWLIPIAISLLGLAASWGATKVEVSNVQQKVQEIKVDGDKSEDRVRTIELTQARLEEILKSINNNLEGLNKKIDRHMEKAH